ncbi:MAG: ketol-acid reductoisomerase [Phycisphaeraceae bacterium]|nr:ketol-acid reductoisomerase [Phycisphaeraceae bacterium]
MVKRNAKRREVTVYRDDDADLAHLKGKRVVIIGYGNQGRSQAMNLRDSGVQVVVASIRDTSAEKAVSDGFEVLSLKDATRAGEILMMLIPDEVQRHIYETQIAPGLTKNHTLCFGHGYNYCYGYITPPEHVDVILLAPRMIGQAVRTSYEAGSGAPAYVGVGHDASGNALRTVLALAKGIGATRAGVIEMTFEDETTLDLILEQTLMPIFTRSMLWLYEILVDEGYDPGVVTLEMYGSGEVAEVFKACAQLGFVKQLALHSHTAQYGELSHADKILPLTVRERMVEILKRIRNGEFAKEWTKEQKDGMPHFKALLEEARGHPINQAEAEIARKVRFASTLAG